MSDYLNAGEILGRSLQQFGQTLSGFSERLLEADRVSQYSSGLAAMDRAFGLYERTLKEKRWPRIRSNEDTGAVEPSSGVEYTLGQIDEPLLATDYDGFVRTQRDFIQQNFRNKRAQEQLLQVLEGKSVAHYEQVYRLWETYKVHELIADSDRTIKYWAENTALAPEERIAEVTNILNSNVQGGLRFADDAAMYLEKATDQVYSSWATIGAVEQAKLAGWDPKAADTWLDANTPFWNTDPVKREAARNVVRSRVEWERSESERADLEHDKQVDLAIEDAYQAGQNDIDVLRKIRDALPQYEVEGLTPGFRGAGKQRAWNEFLNGRIDELVAEKNQELAIRETEIIDQRYRSGELVPKDLDDPDVVRILPLKTREYYRSALQADAAAEADRQRKTMWEDNEIKFRSRLETNASFVTVAEIIKAGTDRTIDPGKVNDLLGLRRQLLPAGIAVETAETADPEQMRQFTLEGEIEAGTVSTVPDLRKRVSEMGFTKPDTAYDEAKKVLDDLLEKKRVANYASTQQFVYDNWGDLFDVENLTVEEIERRATIENAAREGVIPEEIQQQWKADVRRQEAEKIARQDASTACSEVVYDFAKSVKQRQDALRTMRNAGTINGDEYNTWYGRIEPYYNDPDREGIITAIRSAYTPAMVGQTVEKTRALTLEMIRATDAMETFFQKYPEDKPKWIEERDRILSAKADKDTAEVISEAFGTSVPLVYATGEGRKIYQTATSQEALREVGKLPVDLQAKFRAEQADKVHLLSLDTLGNAGLVRKNIAGVVTTKYYTKSLESGEMAGEMLYSIEKPIEYDAEGKLKPNDSMYVVRYDTTGGIYTPEVWKLVTDKDRNGRIT